MQTHILHVMGACAILYQRKCVSSYAETQPRNAMLLLQQYYGTDEVFRELGTMNEHDALTFPCSCKHSTTEGRHTHCFHGGFNLNTKASVSFGAGN